MPTTPNNDLRLYNLIILPLIFSNYSDPRRPIGARGPSLDILSDQLQNIDLKKAFNINAMEFVPK